MWAASLWPQDNRTQSKPIRAGLSTSVGPEERERDARYSGTSVGWGVEFWLVRRRGGHEPPDHQNMGNPLAQASKPRTGFRCGSREGALWSPGVSQASCLIQVKHLWSCQLLRRDHQRQKKHRSEYPDCLRWLDGLASPSTGETCEPRQSFSAWLEHSSKTVPVVGSCCGDQDSFYSHAEIKHK